MNLKVQPGHTVNAWPAGTVITPVAVEGGHVEIDRLFSVGALAWCNEEPAEFMPAANSAVAEMPDDELTLENQALKAELDAAKAKLETVEAEVTAKAKHEVEKAKAEHNATLNELDAAKAKLEAVEKERAELLAQLETMKAEEPKPTKKK
jgi:hypothetical protein